MNDILRLLKTRKSVRAYADSPIDPEHKRAILEAALQAPTAGNMTLYSIIDVTNAQLKQKLSVTCDNQPFIAQAPLVLVFCADYRRWYDVFCAYVDEVRKPSYGDYTLAAADALIAAQNAVVAAESFGIGSCYIGDITENYEIHKEILQLPQYVVPVCMLCFGYPTEQQINRPKPPRFAVEDIVSENSYSRLPAQAVAQQLMNREGMTSEKFGEWIQRFCQRKWNSDFSVEMSRSCQAMLKDWCEEKTV